MENPIPFVENSTSVKALIHSKYQGMKLEIFLDIEFLHFDKSIYPECSLDDDMDQDLWL